LASFIPALEFSFLPGIPQLMTNSALSKNFYDFELLLDTEFSTTLVSNLSGSMGRLFKSFPVGFVIVRFF
jgi:hypothetical protein